jgi:hypothetical protein
MGRAAAEAIEVVSPFPNSHRDRSRRLEADVDRAVAARLREEVRASLTW